MFRNWNHTPHCSRFYSSAGYAWVRLPRNIQPLLITEPWRVKNFCEMQNLDYWNCAITHTSAWQTCGFCLCFCPSDVFFHIWTQVQVSAVLTAVAEVVRVHERDGHRLLRVKRALVGVAAVHGVHHVRHLLTGVSDGILALLGELPDDPITERVVKAKDSIVPPFTRPQ